MNLTDWTVYIIAIRPHTESTMRIPTHPQMTDEAAEILVERVLGENGFVFGGLWLTRGELR